MGKNDPPKVARFIRAAYRVPSYKVSERILVLVVGARVVFAEGATGVGFIVFFRAVKGIWRRVYNAFYII